MADDRPEAANECLNPRLLVVSPLLSYSNITLRDLFAAAALQGAIAHGGYADGCSYHAARAYEMADAMLEQRRVS